MTFKLLNSLLLHLLENLGKHDFGCNLVDVSVRSSPLNHLNYRIVYYLRQMRSHTCATYIYVCVYIHPQGPVSNVFAHNRHVYAFLLPKLSHSLESLSLVLLSLLLWELILLLPILVLSIIKGKVAFQFQGMRIFNLCCCSYIEKSDGMLEFQWRKWWVEMSNSIWLPVLYPPNHVLTF